MGAPPKPWILGFPDGAPISKTWPAHASLSQNSPQSGTGLRLQASEVYNIYPESAGAHPSLSPSRATLYGGKGFDGFLPIFTMIRNISLGWGNTTWTCMQGTRGRSANQTAGSDNAGNGGLLDMHGGRRDSLWGVRQLREGSEKGFAVNNMSQHEVCAIA